MILNEFKRILKREINSWDINDRFTLYRKNYTVWDSELDVEYTHKTLDEALNFEVDGIKLSVLVENLPNDYFRNVELNGSGGGGSGERMKVGGNERSGKPSERLLPAIRNTSTDKQVGNGGRAKNAQDALDNFSNAHRNSKIEYSVTTDDNGYVHSYRKGKKSSVTPDLIPNMHVTHNHPSGSNFSTQDLKVFSSTQIKSITATGSRGTFKIERGAKFDSKGFNQSIKRLEKRGLAVGGLNATDTVDKYNKGLSKWLRVNQKRFGYVFTATPTKG